MLSSSRDSWERLVAAVLKRQQIWELYHQQSRTPSICSTISSDDLSVQTSRNSASFSVHPLPQLPPEVPSVSQGDKVSVDIPADYPKVYQGQLERFSLHQLLVATDKFSRKKLLGKVYKGRLIDGTLVAIKGLWTTDGELQFQTKVQMCSIMAVAGHSNVLRLRGFCMNSREQFLVYPYMVNGSLASYLRGRQLVPLDWGTRKRIALGIARGLCYLHDHKIIHCNVKASNILLDEEYEAVVGDFSSAKLMDHNDTRVTAVVRGDIGCITPEYLSTGKTSEKTDVYGYGATLLELITGQTTRALARLASDDDLMLFDWVKEHLKEKKLDLSKKEKKKKKKKEKKLEMLVDPALRKNYVDEEVEFLIQVSLLCTQSSPLGRPKMSEVVRLIEENRLRMGTTSWLWGSFFKKFK